MQDILFNTENFFVYHYGKKTKVNDKYDIQIQLVNTFADVFLFL